MGRVRAFALRLGFALVVTAVAVVAAEYTARFIYRNVRSSGNGGDYFGSRGSGPAISVNSLGYREREIGRKSPDRYHIAVIGDSFTWGQGIEAAERYTNLLEGYLGPRYEVLNFGIPGHDMPEHLGELDQVLTLSPDFILLQLYINDFETRGMERPRPRPLLSSPDLDRRMSRSSVLYDMLSGKWAQLQETMGSVESYTHYLERNLRDPNAPNAREAFAMLTQFIERARAAGVPCGTVLFPAPDAMGPHGANYPFGYIHDRVQTICTDEKITCLDLLPAFSAIRDPRSMWVSPFDAHPNAMANRYAAQEILARFGGVWYK